MTFKEFLNKFNDKKSVLLFEALVPPIGVACILGYLFITGNYTSTGLWTSIAVLGLLGLRTFWLLREAGNAKPGEKRYNTLPPDAGDTQKIKYWTYTVKVSLILFPFLILVCYWTVDDIEHNNEGGDELTPVLSFLYHNFGGYWPALLIPLIFWAFFIFFLVRKINVLKSKF